jgi:hypothetical protein
MARTYYMLIASLPHLPHFLQAERLPINAQRLQWRRSALDSADAADLDGAMGLLLWQRQSLEQTDEEMDRRFGRLMLQVRHPGLRGFLDEQMGQRSVMAGLRRKQQGLPAPGAGERCGVGRWDRIIRQRWDRDDFALGARFPWLARVRSLLADGSAREIEKLLLSLTWEQLGRIAEREPFGFAAVFAYVFRWDILARWLSYDGDRACPVFQQLVEEAIGEQKIEFE